MTQPCEQWTARNTRIGCASSILMSSYLRGRSRCLPAMSSAGFGAPKPPTIAQYRRHQESGRRCIDRSSDLRQDSRGTRGRHQSARSGVAVEPLRRAAMDLRQRAHSEVEPIWAAGQNTGIRRRGFPGDLVVGCEQGSECWWVTRNFGGTRNASAVTLLGISNRGSWHAQGIADWRLP